MNDKLVSYYNSKIRLSINGVRTRFLLNRFPDGQLQVLIPKNSIPTNKESDLKVEASLNTPELVHIYQQLEYLFYIQLIPSIGQNSEATINYLYGARSDKEETGNYYCTDCAYMMYDSLLSSNVSCALTFTAPHCIDLLKRQKVSFTLPSCVDLSNYTHLVFPDESAYERYKGEIPEGMQYVIAKKERDQESGKIIRYEVEEIKDKTARLLVLDDLCDGGATFMLLADGIGNEIYKDLFIYHGVFSNNAPERLLEKYDNIFVSDSLEFPEILKNMLPEKDKERLQIFTVWTLEP